MALVVPGTAETLQIVDGSSRLPVMQAVHEMSTHSLAFAAPALAYAADMIEAGPSAGHLALSANLRRVLSHCKPPAGVWGDPASYRLLQFGLSEIQLFPGVLRTWRGDPELPVAPLLAQTITSTLVNELTMLLLDTDYHRRLISQLQTTRLAPPVLWI